MGGTAPGTGVTSPGKDMGPAESIMGWRYYGMDMGKPPLTPVDRHTPVKNITFPVLPMQAVKTNL